MLLWLFWSMDW